jgi:hypothetical protein
MTLTGAIIIAEALSVFAELHLLAARELTRRTTATEPDGLAWGVLRDVATW